MSRFLIHIGYPKAASSFLGEWFHCNPYFMFKDFKLLGFSSTAELCSFALSENDTIKYHVIRDMIFSAPLAENVFNCKNLNEYQEKVCKKLYELFPNSKILIVTRGYESAVKAIYSEYLKQGGILSFNDFIHKEDKTEWHPFNYSFLAELYETYFGKDNVLLIPFELLKSTPVEFLSAIENFLNIPHFNFNPKIVNQSLTPHRMSFLRIVNGVFFHTFYIFGPFQKMMYRTYIKLLNKFRKRHLLKSFFFLFSGLCKPSILKLDIDEVCRKYSTHSTYLKNRPLYANCENEYFFHYLNN